MRTLHCLVVTAAVMFPTPSRAEQKAPSRTTWLPTAFATLGQKATVRVPDRAHDGKTWNVIWTDRTLGYPSKQFVNTKHGGQMLLNWNTPLPARGVHQVTLGYGKPNARPIKTAQVRIVVLGPVTPLPPLRAK